MASKTAGIDSWSNNVNPSVVNHKNGDDNGRVASFLPGLDKA